MVGEDATKFGGHRLATDHLASVEADNEAVLGDRFGHPVGITGVPSGDQTLVQAGNCVHGVHGVHEPDSAMGRPATSRPSAILGTI